MSDVSELARRIDAALAAVKEKAQQQVQQRLQEHQERQGLLKEYEKAWDDLFKNTTHFLDTNNSDGIFIVDSMKPA